MPKLAKTKVNKFRKRLLQVLEELGGKLEHMEESILKGDGEISPDEVDEFGSDAYSTEFQIGLLENEEEIRRETLEALQRCDAGTYGVCERCEKLIPERRLEVLPWARYCVACQKAVEEGEE